MVLATDMSRHFADVAIFNSKFAKPKKVQEEDKKVFFEMLL